MLHKIVNDFKTNRTMTDRREGTPKIIIFSSVLRFIGEQVKAVPDHLETGGLLLGTVLDDGRLITHATPPGPEAIHQEGVFQKDLDFSQAILNHLARKTGVEYVGEWHKHPPFLKRPSHGDRQGAAAILQDSDYKTKGMLVFPIWIRERRGTPSSIHEHLIEHYFGRMDAVQCYPYYMDETLQFYPFEFRIAKCDLGAQSEVVSFHNQYIRFEDGRSGNRRENISQKESPQSCKSEVDSTRKERMSLDPGKKEDQERPIEVMDPPCCWHETQVGRERLAQETEYLKNSLCYQGARYGKDGRLLFRLSSPVFDRVFLDVLCRQDHPRSLPDLFLRYKEQCLQINKAVNARSGTTTENPFSETMYELNGLWKKTETSMWIYHIAKSLGFY
ncbi:MAG: Mov34/MPN/PAD-1 family protein [Deltaproteobacteria bacterium]|nr:Mov34/MPN/PAD-1 family protein [Deltaproteobacteria bacterium]